MAVVARFLRLAVLMALVAPIIAACASNHGTGVKRAAFTSKEFGVSASPRVTTTKYPRRGGGRVLAANAYVVRGTTYQPVAGPGYVARGEASWYGQDFHGRLTANGEIFGAYYLTAASPVLPVPSYARVTNLENGRSVTVRINDRGPYLQGRVADVSYETAKLLGFLNKGSAQIEISYVGPAPLNVDDNRMLMASLSTTPGATPAFEQGDTRVALANTTSQPSRPTSRDPFSGGLIGGIVGLFGYAAGAEGTDVNAAVAAASAVAEVRPELEDWQRAVDIDSRRVKLPLGVFVDRARADAVADQFALLGAVDEIAVTVKGRAATQLVLTMLKPGVGRADVNELAQRLGLTDIYLDPAG